MTTAQSEAQKTPGRRKLRLAYLVSHPIQYQAPLLRRIAQEPDIDFTVLFGSDFSLKSYQDKGFGVDVKWDVPLLDGYHSEFLPSLRDNGTEGLFSPISRGIFRRLRGDSTNEPYDLLWIHGYSTVNAIHGFIAAKALGIPVLLRAESWLQDRARTSVKLAQKKIFFNFLQHFVTAVLAIGTFNKEYWQHYFGEDFPLFVMPYAVDNVYFQSKTLAAQPTRQLLLEEWGMEAGRPVILFASKLQRRKHCGDLIEAYQRLIADCPAAQQPYLLIVGDGEERAELEARTAALQLKDVRFCGFKNQSEMPRYFDLCSVFVLPSRHEPWGLIVNEVMNARRPVILSDDVGCQPDLITDGVEGFVFPVGDIDALTLALRRIFETPETATRMSESAFQRITTWSFEEDIVALRKAIAHVTGRLQE
jgi:glycosyltransferase involved in cell wall biosynthesis